MNCCMNHSQAPLVGTVLGPSTPKVLDGSRTPIEAATYQSMQDSIGVLAITPDSLLGRTLSTTPYHVPKEANNCWLLPPAS